MNKIQESFTKIIIQYVKETYPNDQTLKYLIDGIDNFTDKNIQTEVDKPKYLCTPISESLLNDKDRIKEIMNKILDVNFKPTGVFVKPNDIFIEPDKDIPTDEKRNVIEELRKHITPIDNNPERIEEQTIPTEDIKE